MTKITTTKHGRSVFYTDGELLGERTTSIIGQLDKPALQWWAVDCALDKVEDMLKGVTGIDAALLERVRRKARVARFEKSEEALDVGSTFHSLAELYVNTGKVNLKPYPAIIKKLFNQFKTWMQENKVEAVETEIAVFHKRLYTYCESCGNGVGGFDITSCVQCGSKHLKAFVGCYGGRADLLCRINNVLHILDYKTSKAVYEPDMPMQLAAYREAWQQTTGSPERIGGCGILRLDKIGGELEFKHYSFDDISKHVPMFMSLLDHKQWRNFKEGSLVTVL